MKAVPRLARWLAEQHELHLISHYDADGLVALALIEQALRKRSIQTHIHVHPGMPKQLPERTLLIDMGASEASRLPETCWVLDHHRGEASDRQLNPWLEGLDGGQDACSSTLAALIAEELGYEETAIAIVGILADGQEKRGLRGLNKEFVERAVSAGQLTVEERLRLFGYDRFDLVTLLVKSRDLQIPGVTGNRDGAVAFLSELRIPSRVAGRATRFDDLDALQRDRLRSEGSRRARRAHPTGLHATLTHETVHFRDARSFATMLNACGRLEESEIALGALRGDSVARERAGTITDQYRDELRKAYAWFGEHATGNERYRLFSAERAILPSLVGTVCSMATRSGDVPQDCVVMGMARNTDGTTKLSIRVNDHSDRDVLALLEKILDGAGRCGGHRVAAGALIPTSVEGDVLERAVRILADRGA